MVTLPPVVVHEVDNALLARAEASFAARDYAEALRLFREVLADEPNDPIRTTIREKARASARALRDYDSAIALGRLLLTPTPHSREELARDLAMAGQFDEVVVLTNDAETIRGRGLRAWALAELHRLDEALRDADRIVTDAETSGYGQTGALPVALAPAYLALAEVRRQRGEGIALNTAAAFADKLEARCQSLLDAQAAYTHVIRCMDPEWALLAGVRIGAMYQTLHRDVMSLTPPSSARRVQQKQLWEGAMRLRYRILLEKGLRMIQSVLRLAERTHTAGPWVQRARETENQLQQSLAEERDASAKIPYTEEELRRALEGLSTPRSVR